MTDVPSPWLDEKYIGHKMTGGFVAQPQPAPLEEGAPKIIGRHFPSGAYRDTDEGKLDFEGFLSPLVLQAYGEYMDKHRLQSDGQLRDSDNWQAGIPRSEYVRSLLRHAHDLWMEHRGYESRDGIDEALGGLLFNVMGFWLELLKERRG